MDVMNVNEFIPELFLRLTSKTYPHGYESIIVKELMYHDILPKDLKQDDHGNYFYEIGESRTIFASHLDTVSSKHEPVTHVLDGEIIRTDGTTTLGADDKAGVAILIWMMKHKIPGTYYFFVGEEVGCIGSGLAAKYGEFKGKYDRIISFDRRGTDSIITHQSWSRCCSDAFADAFCSELNKAGLDLKYIKDDGGVYTDSAEFVDLIPECTNVSVGYYKEHTFTEHQDMRHLVNLCTACLGVDWENLPTKRNPEIYEGKSFKTYSTSNWSDYSSNKNKTKVGGSWSKNGTVAKERDYNYYDNWYDTEEDEDGNRSIHDFYEDRNSWTPKISNTKRTRRGKKSKTYYDNGGNLVEIKSNDDKVYDFHMTKFSSSKLKEKELEVIAEQYLDIDGSEYDRYFYETLVEEMSK
jgi:hypothetical protein